MGDNLFAILKELIELAQETARQNWAWADGTQDLYLKQAFEKKAESCHQAASQLQGDLNNLTRLMKKTKHMSAILYPSNLNLSIFELPSSNTFSSEVPPFR
jgi:hypothetical protein